MPTHATVNGRSIDYEPTVEEARFLRRIEAAVGNPAVGEAELRALIFGADSPLFDQGAGYSFAAPGALESPVFRVALDLLDRKRVATGALDPELAAARYTLSGAEAAEQLGVSNSTVRMAVTEGRLPSWMRDGQIALTPASVDADQVSRRGRPPRLAVTCGSADGASLRIWPVGGELEVLGKEAALVHGQVASWSKAGVITGLKRTGPSGKPETSYRYWLLEPGGVESRVELGPLHVAGRFTIKEKRNGPAASEAFAALKAASGGEPEQR